MTPLFKKLNYKTGEICIVNAPESFDAELHEMRRDTTVITDAKKVRVVDFLMAFCITQKEVDVYAKLLTSKLKEDGVLWFCYPKGTSKKYKCEFNRDSGWAVLAELGFEPVRAVAIDEDWSALRFRKPQHIKTMTRSFAMTPEGKSKIAKQKKN